MVRSPLGFIRQNFTKKIGFNGIVFLDRDGTLIKDINYLSSSSQIEILPAATDGVRRLNRNKIAVVVITNQPVIARGKASVGDVGKINKKIFDVFMKYNAVIDAFYFCPHHPEKNHPDIPIHALKYRINCECRKPKVAMLKAAVKDFDASRRNAYMVGDRTSDIKTGENFGIKTILVRTGAGGGDKKYHMNQNYLAENFNQAVDIILEK